MTETVPATVETIVDEPADFTIVAANPSDMEKAQKSMILWCARKIVAAKKDLEDARTNLETAAQKAWPMAPWARRVEQDGKRLGFYKKVKAALEAGYYIVPPFPVDVFAIRTTRKRPDPRRGGRWEDRRQRAKLLSQGEGRYVSEEPTIYSRKIPSKDREGKDITVDEYFAKEFRPVDFPFKLARPDIVNATVAAMELGIFDQMGALPPRRRNADPIIVGQILMPHRNNDPLTFFVTWWLDTRSL